MLYYVDQRYTGGRNRGNLFRSCLTTMFRWFHRTVVGNFPQEFHGQVIYDQGIYKWILWDSYRDFIRTFVETWSDVNEACWCVSNNLQVRSQHQLQNYTYIIWIYKYVFTLIDSWFLVVNKNICRKKDILGTPWPHVSVIHDQSMWEAGKNMFHLDKGSLWSWSPQKWLSYPLVIKHDWQGTIQLPSGYDYHSYWKWTISGY